MSELQTWMRNITNQGCMAMRQDKRDRLKIIFPISETVTRREGNEDGMDGRRTRPSQGLRMDGHATLSQTSRDYFGNFSG